MKDYVKIIKDLQLDGSLNKIHEEIRLHYVSEFEKCREYKDYKMVHIHFIDRLMIVLDAEPKLIDQILYYYYELSTKDEEFIKSLEEYRNYVDDIKFSKRKDVLTKLDDAQLNEIDLFVKNLGKTFE